jgi:hypothetical protein
MISLMVNDLIVGNRYAGKGGGLIGITWEIIEFDGNHGKSKLISYPDNTREIGEIVKIDSSFYRSDNWEFIGNFSKSSNFRNIYDILNGD